MKKRIGADDFIECSAKNNENIIDVFKRAAMQTKRSRKFKSKVMKRNNNLKCFIM